RTQRAFDAIVEGKGKEASDPIEAVRRSYERGITVEIIEPIAITGRRRLRPGKDTAIFFNFRPDRARQLSMKLVEAGADITTMTKYRSDLDVPVALPEQEVQETLAEVLSEHGVRQLHVAETEKYANVTYFFNCGPGQQWAGGTRM